MTVTKGALSRRTTENLERADRARRRRVEGGVTFRGVGQALTWFYEMRQKLVGPQGMHPRGELSADGEVVFVQVDGGRGGDMDDVMATVSTIGAIVRELALHHPVEHLVIELRFRDGKTQRELADLAGLGIGTASAVLGRAEFYVLAGLRDAGVVR